MHLCRPPRVSSAPPSPPSPRGPRRRASAAGSRRAADHARGGGGGGGGRRAVDRRSDVLVPARRSNKQQPRGPGDGRRRSVTAGAPPAGMVAQSGGCCPPQRSTTHGVGTRPTACDPRSRARPFSATPRQDPLSPPPCSSLPATWRVPGDRGCPPRLAVCDGGLGGAAIFMATANRVPLPAGGRSDWLHPGVQA